MSGGFARIAARSSWFSWPVYRLNVTGGRPSKPKFRNLPNSSSWLLARAFIGYTTIALMPLPLPSRRTRSTIGTMYASDLPEPVPVVRT